jgi:cytochrome P450
MTALPRALAQMPIPTLPPDLPSGKLLGHFTAFRRDPLGLLLRGRREVGDLVGIRIGPQRAYFVYDAEAVGHVLVDNFQAYSKQTRGYEALRMLLGQGLVTSEGSFWRRQRRIAQPAFHRQRLAGIAEVMRGAAADLVERWEPLADGREVNVADEMMRVTLRIAGEALFSVDLADDSEEVGGAVADMLRWFNQLFLGSLPGLRWLPTPTKRRGQRAMKVLDALVRQIIAGRRSSGDHGNDLLGMLMDACDEDTGESMSDGQLRDEVVTMLTAGHETTAQALTWTLYLLSKHPLVAQRVEAEIDRVLPAGAPPTALETRELRYTSQVLSESMRLYPPVWAVARRAEQDDVLAGHALPAGSYVVLSPFAVHRHPRYWPNPEGFDPDRFAPERLAEDKARGRPKHAYFPFAAGPRKCIGDHFAEQEALIVLGAILRRYRPALVPGARIELEPSVTLRPKYGMPMTLARR